MHPEQGTGWIALRCCPPGQPLENAGAARQPLSHFGPAPPGERREGQAESDQTAIEQGGAAGPHYGLALLAR